jgi:XTP/dITP diphosphohydrolase
MNTNAVLVLGTRNRKKGEELQELLAPLGVTVQTLDEFPAAVDVVEDGDSFAANAALKATQQATAIGQWVLGEDSGIAVDALDGAPGIYSARFAGPDATDDENNRHLLERLGDLPLEKRDAKYVCHMTLADPEGNIRAESEAECRGRIRFEPAGTHGFGYDPLFEVVEYHRTFGQLGPAVKSALSHRARAAAALVPQLHKLIASGAWTMSE